MGHYNPNAGDSYTDSPLTPLEMALTAKHGDLHSVIPKLASQMTYQEVADELHIGGGRPSESFIRRWLKNNGYERRVCYVRPTTDDDQKAS
jgi:ribonuclease BN (tRNA processing enzyme)